MWRDAWTVARKDATEIWRDGRFRWMAGLTLVLMAASLAGGTAHQARVARQHADAQQSERDLSLDRGDMNPHSAAHYGAFVFKPVEPLSALDPGIDPFVGTSVFLEAHQQQLSRHRPVEDATTLRRLGEMTAAMALQVLVPLLIVALTFGSIAGERERGTLRQTIGAGIGRGALGLGKAAGVVAPLAAVVAPAALIGVAAIVTWSGGGVDRDAVARAGAMALAYLAYFAIWMALGIGISARAQTSGAALVVLVGLWFASSLVAPPLAASIASVRHPSPDTIAFAAAIEREKAGRPGWDARVAAAEERFLAGEAMPSAANPEVVALIESEADDTELYNRHFSRLFDIYERQSRAYQQLGVGAPMLAVQSLSMALAGTDYAHYRRFLNATSDYRTAFIDMLNRELAGLASWKSFSMMSGRELWSRLPEFEFDTAPVRWALTEQAWSLLALGAWLVASSAFAVWAVRSAPID